MAFDWTVSKQAKFTIGDITGGVVNLDTLSAEISNPANGVVANASEFLHTKPKGYLHLEATVIIIVFDADRTAAQKTAFEAAVAAHAGAVTSRNHQFWEDDSLDTDTTEAWVTVMSRTANPLKGGRYKVTWQCELRLDRVGPLDSRSTAQLLINNGAGDIEVGQASHDGGAFDTKGGVDLFVAKEGDAPVLKIRFRRAPAPGGDDTAEIRRKKLSIELWR